MRCTLNIEITGLPKSLSEEILGVYLERRVSSVANELVAGNRKAKATVTVGSPTTGGTNVANATEPVAKVKGKPGRKPKVASADPVAPVTDVADPSDAEA